MLGLQLIHVSKRGPEHTIESISLIVNGVWERRVIKITYDAIFYSLLELIITLVSFKIISFTQ